MIRYIFLGFILLLAEISFGQNLSLTDLENISNKENWESVNQKLIAKGWEYYESAKGSAEKYHTITWAYERNSYNDRAQAWCYLYTFEGLPNKIRYDVFNQPAFTSIQNSLNGKGYKLTESEIEDNELISTYANSKFILKITTEKRVKDNDYSSDESHTAYSFLLIKKSGVYDPDNGKKTNYYYGDVKQAEYTLKNGVLNGQFTKYYTNGLIEQEGNYIDGKENGPFVEYDDKGNVTFKYSMKNDELNGIFISYYPNGQIQKKGNYLEGKGNGSFIEYDEEANRTYEYSMKNGMNDGLLKFYESNKISHSTTYSNGLKNGDYVGYYYGNVDGVLYLRQEGQYLSDEADGTWKLIAINDGEERLLSYDNYEGGLKNGQSQEVRNDSLIFCNYYNDELSGEYKVYRDFTKMLIGGIINTDTSEIVLTTEGRYFDGRKSGYWENYYLTGNLSNEGSYIEGEKEGEWKYYRQRWGDENGKELPYSEELFLIENYSNDKLNGKSTRYSYLEEEAYPCSEKDENKSLLDTCYEMVYTKVFEVSYYKNNMLNGPFEVKDSTNQTIAKGQFVNDKMNGHWVFRLTEKDSENNDRYYYQEGSFKAGEKDGEWIKYYNKGVLTNTSNYYQGDLHGKSTDWYSSNRPYQEKQFRYGRLKTLVIYDSLGVTPSHKYKLTYNVSNSINCEETRYYTFGYTSQEYWIKKDEDIIDHNWFWFKFLLVTNPDNPDFSKAYRDGQYKLCDSGGKPITTGKYLKDDKIGLWTNFYYDQNTKIESNFEKNVRLDEKYLTLNDELYSGEFELINDNDDTKEVRKIKDGVRNGKTVFIDIPSGKTIQKVSYKDGVLR